MARKKQRKTAKPGKKQKIRNSFQNQILSMTQVLINKFGEKPPHYVVSTDLRTLPTPKLKGLRDALQDRIQALTEQLRKAVELEREEAISKGLICAQCDEIIKQVDMDAGTATVDLCPECMVDF